MSLSRVSLCRGPLDATWRSVRADSPRVAVRGLDPGTRYAFSVAPIHAEGFEGFRSPQVNYSTCGSEYACVRVCVRAVWVCGCGCVRARCACVCVCMRAV